MNNINQPEENKEEFCSLCVSSGLAVLGAGGVGYSAFRKKGETQQNRKIALAIGLVSLLLSLYFYLRYTRECKLGGSSECSD